MALGSKNDLRVLIAMENAQAAEGARGVFKQMGVDVIKVATDKRTSLELMEAIEFNLLLVEDSFSDLGGLDFCRFIRMISTSTSVAPLIYCMKMPDRDKVVAARDAGINKILLMPFTAGSVIKTVQEIMLQPRPVIQVAGYSGPCRRTNTKAARPPVERRQKQEGLIPVSVLQKHFKGKGK